MRFPAGVKEAGENKAVLGVATRATTITRPLLPAVVQMCRTFQKSSVNRVVRPCRDSRPHAPVGVEVQDVFEDDTGVAESRDAWLAEATAVTGTSVFRRSGMMAGGIAGAARTGRPGGASRGRAARLWRSVPGAAGQRLGGMPTRPL